MLYVLYTSVVLNFQCLGSYNMKETKIVYQVALLTILFHINKSI